MDSEHWATTIFGEVGLDIRKRIPELVRAEQQGSADAQEASGHRSRSVFGQFWRGVLERFEEFGSLPGGTLVNPGRAPYRVPVVNGVVLFPWRYGDGRSSATADVAFATSDAREALFKPSPLYVQDSLDFGEFDEESDGPDVPDMAGLVRELTTREKRKVVVVAIACSTIGLQDITWGEVRLTDDGFLEFLEAESLLGLIASRPLAAAGATGSFVAGEPPRKRLQLQGEPEGPEVGRVDA